MKSILRLSIAGLAIAAWCAPASAATVPYQHQGFINTNSCQNNQCIISFPNVPQGKRLTLTSVSAQLLMTMTSIVLEGSGVAYFVAKPYANAGNLSAPISLHYEAGQTPTARMFSPNPTDNNSLIVVLVGHLEDAP